ncbi:MAG: tripartite tricarboxylate transporter substrate binding protein [Rhodocyclaceae bacterium]|nr:tripartite tricarboxylate transporter substrate binding protein [Rhodocyclaceae bacterium]
MKQRNGSNAAPERSTAPGLALAALAATALMAAAGSAQAQPAWPSKPVRMIVNFGAGGSADTMARLVAPSMQEAFGQPIVIEIRAGATGSIGADFVARQPPDGYTLLLTSGAFSMAPALTTKLPYDIFRDFTPVIGTSNAPQVLVVHPSVPVKTVKELVAFAKARPGQLGWATAGIGSTGHLAGEYFSSLVGIKLNHVPYKSNPAARMDVIGGHVPIMFDQLSTAAQHIKAGKVRALAITSPKRHPLLPDVPNMVEVGFPAFETSIWLGILGPANLPRPIVDRINTVVNGYLAQPATRERFAQLGLEIYGGTPETLGARMKADLAGAQKTVKAAGIKPE